MPRYREEKTAICINCEHNARFPGRRKTVFVQGSHAIAGVLLRVSPSKLAVRQGIFSNGAKRFCVQKCVKTKR